MRRAITHAAAVTGLLLAPACFEEPIIIVPMVGDTGAATAASSSGGGPADATTAVAGSSSSGGVDPDGGSSSTGPGADSSGTTAALDSTTGSSGGCEAEPLAELLWAEDAVLTFPMQLITAIYLPTQPWMARSTAAEAGEVQFEFELGCATTVDIHGLMWDFTGAPRSANPDSYYVSLDEGPEWLWNYGCQTEGMGDGIWAWLKLVEHAGAPCAGMPLTFELEAGTHQLRLRNHEAGAGENFAAIAAIVVTDDLAFDPATLFDPNP